MPFPVRHALLSLQQALKIVSLIATNLPKRCGGVFFFFLIKCPDKKYKWSKIFFFTLPTKVRLVKAMVSPVVMYGCESWTVKKAER